MSCLTERSRITVRPEPVEASPGVSGPRKYFEATTLVAFWDHVAGISISFCSKTGLPSAPSMLAVRTSHSSLS